MDKVLDTLFYNFKHNFTYQAKEQHDSCDPNGWDNLILLCNQCNYKRIYNKIEDELSRLKELSGYNIISTICENFLRLLVLEIKYNDGYINTRIDYRKDKKLAWEVQAYLAYLRGTLTQKIKHIPKSKDILFTMKFNNKIEEERFFQDIKEKNIS